MEVKIVLGHAFGDEGKGVTVQWLCKQAIERGKRPLVIRFSGGPQAAHTIVNNGVEHICSSFGSGVLLGVPTYLCRDVFIDPICLVNELRKLKAKGAYPKIYGTMRYIITPYDVIAGRKDAKVIADGTCGKGIYPTFKRYQSAGCYSNYGPHNLAMAAAYHKLDRIKDYDRMFNDALSEIMEIADDEAKFNDFDVYIFEGSQGLLLDMERGFYPNVTPSKVGLNGIPEGYLRDAELYLVTRSYTTRHGNGYEPQFHKYLPDLDDKHETNVDNEYQGAFKTGLLDVSLLNTAYSRHCIDNYVKMYNMKQSLVVTHIDVWDKSPSYKVIIDSKVIDVLIGGNAPRDICGLIKATLNYTPDAVFYNDSVESNIKKLDI